MGIIINNLSNNLSRTKKLGEILIDSGLLSLSQLEIALAEGKKRNLRLGTALSTLGILSEDTILEALSSQMGLKTIDLSKIEMLIDPAVGKLIPEGLSRQFKMVAVSLSDGILAVALSDPLNVFATDALKRHVTYNIEIFLAKDDEILRAIDFIWMSDGESEGQKIISIDDYDFSFNTPEEDFQKTKVQPSAPKVSSHVYKEPGEMEDINIVKLLNDIISSSANNGASDIHIEPLTDDIIVRERIDGNLSEVRMIPRNFLNPLIARIKKMGNMDIAEKRNPQDSRFDINIGEKNIGIRVSIVPMINGEKAVLRLLDKSSKVAKVSDLPIDNDEKEKILEIIYKKYGLFLITGPTGSGKTATAYSMIAELNSVNKNIITVEDPVEYKIKYVNQIEVNQKGGVGFADALRAVLKQDPDIIFVGEIRDEETARMSIQAALTGHLVISTVNSKDSSSAISMLMDMGVEPFLISSSISGVIGQRLVRRLCDKCKKPYTPEPELLKELGLPAKDDFTFYRETGCDFCKGTGFQGRINIKEILIPTASIQKLIIEKADALQIKNDALKGGFIPLRMAGFKKVMEGVTTLEEILRAMQDI